MSSTVTAAHLLCASASARAAASDCLQRTSQAGFAAIFAPALKPCSPAPLPAVLLD